jgi:hypothetical protein
MTAATCAKAPPVNYVETLTTTYAPSTKDFFGSNLIAVMAEQIQNVRAFPADPVFDRLFAEISSLRVDPDEDAPPTQFAVDEALGLIGSVRARFTGYWTEPHIATDGYGGLRFSWRNDQKEVRAIIPRKAKGRQYLYWEDGDQYDTVDKFTAVTLASRLDWLYKKQEPTGNGRL